MWGGGGGSTRVRQQGEREGKMRVRVFTAVSAGWYRRGRISRFRGGSLQSFQPALGHRGCPQWPGTQLWDGEGR